MCRYGFKTYKSHLVCFTCHKAFKQIAFEDLFLKVSKTLLYKEFGSRGKDIFWAWHLFSDKEKSIINKMQDEYAKEINQKRFKCPECGQLMADLGLDFKAPRKTAIKQWKIIEGMYTIGHSWHTCGCNGPGFIPKEKYQYIEYLKNHLAGFNEQLHSSQNVNVDDKEKNNNIKYWANRVELVQKELSNFTL